MIKELLICSQEISALISHVITETWNLLFIIQVKFALVVLRYLPLLLLYLVAVLHVKHAWWSAIVTVFAVGYVADSHPHADEHQRQHEVLQEYSVDGELDQ